MKQFKEGDKVHVTGCNNSNCPECSKLTAYAKLQSESYIGRYGIITRKALTKERYKIELKGSTYKLIWLSTCMLTAKSLVAKEIPGGVSLKYEIGARVKVTQVSLPGKTRYLGIEFNIRSQGSSDCHINGWLLDEAGSYVFGEEELELICSIKKEVGNMNKIVADVYEKTADAVVVDKYMSSEINSTFIDGLIVRQNKEAILVEAKRREAEDRRILHKESGQ